MEITFLLKADILSTMSSSEYSELQEVAAYFVMQIERTLSVMVEELDACRRIPATL
jgi:hypothetical protein